VTPGFKADTPESFFDAVEHRVVTPNDWARFIDAWAEDKGLNEEERTQGDWAALVHTEISEAFESWRNGEPLFWIRFWEEMRGSGKPEGAAAEYADALIRIFHWFAQHNMDVDQVLKEKMKFNLEHGGEQA